MNLREKAIGGLVDIGVEGAAAAAKLPARGVRLAGVATFDPVEAGIGHIAVKAIDSLKAPAKKALRKKLAA